jgi:hypothetical protein
VHDLADEHRTSSSPPGEAAYYEGLGHTRWHDAVTDLVADVTLFDGRSVRTRRGVLFATEDIEWVGAHARAPKAARAAREVDGAGRP